MDDLERELQSNDLYKKIMNKGILFAPVIEMLRLGNSYWNDFKGYQQFAVMMIGGLAVLCNIVKYSQNEDCIVDWRGTKDLDIAITE